jgi:hypothetical protein
MGLYIEPPGNKTSWIFTYNSAGIDIASPRRLQAQWEDLQEAHPNELPVAYLNNGAFVALAVAFNRTEFLRLAAGRPDARWFLVPKSVLRTVVPGGKKIKELQG